MAVVQVETQTRIAEQLAALLIQPGDAGGQRLRAADAAAIVQLCGGQGQGVATIEAAGLVVQLASTDRDRAFAADDALLVTKIGALQCQAAVGAVGLGVLFSLLRSAETRWIRIPVAIVLEFLRGMPVLLMMLFILLAGSTGAYWAVVIALILYNGALIGEALRAGLAALPRGQREAGLSLGMRPLQSRLLVEFPQAFRQMLPIIVAQLVVLLKDTSLGFIVGYPELIRVTMNNIASAVGNRYLFSLFFVTLVLYLIMNLSLSWFARWLSRRTASGGGKVAKGKKPPQDPNSALLVVQASADARTSATGGAG